MMKPLTILLIIFSLSNFIFGQNVQKEDASKQFSEGNIKVAIDLSLKSLSNSKTKIEKSEIYYLLGQCYEELLEFDIAVKYYKLSYKLDPDYKETIYRIAKSLKRDEQFSEAEKYFNKYKSNSVEKEAADMQIESIEIAKKWMNEPSSYKVTLNKNLSSPFFDFSPNYINEDKSSMILTSSRAFEDSASLIGRNFSIFYSKKNGTSWTIPLPMDTTINEANNEGVVTIDLKRKVIFFTRCHGKRNEKNASCDIYYSFMEGELMGEPMLLDLGIPDSLKAIFGHPSYSNEFDLLFFVSNMNGGYGGKDIWVTKYYPEKDSWEVPKNLGPEVNTSGDELFPFIASDGTLYYSSEGGVSMGGLDIFKALKINEFSWGNVENMKYPINSVGDDFGIILNDSKKSGYFSSNRKGGLGQDDIYEFELVDTLLVSKPETLIKDENSSDNLEALIQFFNKKSCTIDVDSKLISDVKIYPNPNNGIFKLDFLLNKSVSLIIRIHNTVGQLIYIENIQMNEGQFSKEINIQDYKNGIYYLQVLYNCEKIHSEKLVKY